MCVRRSWVFCIRFVDERGDLQHLVDVDGDGVDGVARLGFVVSQPALGEDDGFAGFSDGDEFSDDWHVAVTTIRVMHKFYIYRYCTR